MISITVWSNIIFRVVRGVSVVFIPILVSILVVHFFTFHVFVNVKILLSVVLVTIFQASVGIALG